VARKSGGGRRGKVVVGACAAGGVAVLLAGVWGVGPWRGAPGRVAAAARLSNEVTITSPRPYFVPVSGQGPSLSADRVAWTASNPQGPAGSPIDRIYVYDLARRQLSTPVRSHYGTAGFIGGYALAGGALAYVDTGVTPSRIFTWRVCIVDLRHGGTTTVLTSPPGATSFIPPQVAFDGAHLLVLQSMSRGVGAFESTATLYTPARHTSEVLARLSSPTTSFADPALARDAALWTTQTFGQHPSSRLNAYDMQRRDLRVLPVGDVSQLAASGDLVAWKSGLTSGPGRIGLYSVQRGRVLSDDLAHSDKAIYPAVGGGFVSWTSVDFSRVYVYSMAARGVVYKTPAVPQRVYGLSSISVNTTGTGTGAAWVYTANVSSKTAMRGYVVVRAIGG
jgi:hypothetical protein